MNGRAWIVLSLLTGVQVDAVAYAAEDEAKDDEVTELQPAEAPMGHGEVVERVVAVVNGEALFLSELRRRAVPFLPQVMDNASSELERYSAMKELYGQLLDLLIDEQLIQQAARELSVSVTRDDVARAIENVKSQSGLEEDAFWDAVAAQGFTRDRYRADVRRQLVRLKVINQKVRSRVNITEEDVRRRYDEMARRARRTARFHAAHIFLPISDPTPTQIARVRQQAEALRETLTADNFDQQAQEHGGGDLGWVSQGDLPRKLEEALLELDAGEISQPVSGPSGYHLFLLKERAKTSDSLAAYDEVRGQLYREMLESAMAKQEAQFLDELRTQGLVARRL